MDCKIIGRIPVSFLDNAPNKNWTAQQKYDYNAELGFEIDRLNESQIENTPSSYDWEWEDVIEYELQIERTHGTV